MEYNVIQKNDISLAEIVSDEICLHTADDALDIMVVGGGIRIILMHVHQFAPDFFQLPTGLLGEVLQKFTNYRMKLAVVGDLTPYLTKNFSDFIRESNQTGDFLFVSTKEEAIAMYTKTQ